MFSRRRPSSKGRGICSHVIETIEPRLLLASPAGPEFLISSALPNAFPYPAMATNGAGRTVIVYRTSDDILARIYDASGQPTGNAFVVHQNLAGAQVWSDVALDAAGNFVVTWDSAGDIYARLFSASGAPLSNDILVNTHTAGQQR